MDVDVDLGAGPAWGDVRLMVVRIGVREVVFTLCIVVGAGAPAVVCSFLAGREGGDGGRGIVEAWKLCDRRIRIGRRR